MITATEERTATLAPFGVEADHPRNGDLLIQSIPGCRLRSAIVGTKPIIDKRPGKEGRETIPQDQIRDFGTFPRTPGMQIHINADKLTYSVIDPLKDDEELCEKIQLWMKENRGYGSDGKIRGVPTQKGKLDKHRMKTLCRELFNIVEAEEARFVRGPEPSMAAIEAMPGRFLLNPGSRIRNSQPRFVDQFDKWYEQLVASGG